MPLSSASTTLVPIGPSPTTATRRLRRVVSDESAMAQSRSAKSGTAIGAPCLRRLSQKCAGGNSRSVPQGLASLNRSWHFPSAKSLFEMGDHRQRDVLAPWSCRDLDAERQAFGRGADPYCRGRPSRQIIHLRINAAL